MSDNSDYGDYVAFCKAVGLPMPVSDPAPDDDEAETLPLTPDLAAWREKWAKSFSAPDVEPDTAKDTSEEYSCSCGFLMANCRYGTWRCKQDNGALDDVNDLPLPFEE